MRAGGDICKCKYLFTCATGSSLGVSRGRRGGGGEVLFERDDASPPPPNPPPAKLREGYVSHPMLRRRKFSPSAVKAARSALSLP